MVWIDWATECFCPETCRSRNVIHVAVDQYAVDARAVHFGLSQEFAGRDAQP
jgi:hypothetical protein